MSTDLVLVESASLRREHMDRTDVLDKVKALSLLPDDTHVTTDMLASYYEADANTVAQAVKRNRAELEANGLTVLRGADLREFKAKYSMYLPSEVMRSSHLAVFTRRTVLNMGMLLRDSEIAKQVRSYLLDTEASAVAAFAVPRSLPEALRLAAELAEKAEEAEKRALEGETFKRAIEAGDGLTVREFAKKYFSEVPEKAFNRHLYDRNWLINQSGTGSWDPKTDRYRDGWQHRHPTAKGKPFFYRHGSLDGFGYRHESTRVRSGSSELALRNQLAREGLPPNEQPGLFAIGDAA